MRPRTLLAFALGLSWASCPQTGLADDVADEAELQFVLGAEKYQAGLYRDALAHFLASNRLVPNKNVLFNVASTYEQLKQYPEAFRHYMVALEAESDPDGRKRVEEALTRIRPFVAVLKVESNPPGATIYVDRKDLGARGEAPRSLAFSPQTIRVLVEKEGYETAVVESVVLDQGKEAVVRVDLVRIVGTLSIDLPADAEVRIDDPTGAPVLVGPGDVLVTPGRRRLLITAPGRERVDVEVEIKAKEKTSFKPQLVAESGTLSVSSDVPGALVQVDGEPVGYTPTQMTMPVGRHRVRIALAGYRTIERDVTIEAKAESRLAVEVVGSEQVTAVSRTAQDALEAPSSLTILDGRELRALGYPTIAEALRGVRGVYLSDDRSYTSIGVRGFSRLGDYGNKVLILYDGLVTNDNILGQSFPGFEGLADLDDVERVELVRGPGSSLYGTGAFFGVVNVVRHDSAQPSRLEATASTADGAIRGRVLGYWGTEGEGAIWASLSVAHSEGRDFFFPEFQDEPARGFARDLDDFTSVTGQVVGEVGPFRAQAFYQQRDKGIPTAEYETLFGDDRHRWTDRRGSLELKFEPKVTDWLDSMTRAHGNFYLFDAVSPYAPEDGGVVSEDYAGVWAGLEQRFVFRPADFARVTVGGDVQRHFLARMGASDETSTFLIPDDNPYWVGSGYAEAEFKIGEVATLVGGARLDGFAWEFPEPLGDVSRVAVSPRVSAVLRPYEAGTVKVIGGKAFKAPSVYELLYRGPVQRASPDLEPEDVYSAEVEYTHAFTKNLTLTAAPYFNYVTGLIVGRGAGTEENPLFLVNSDSPVIATGGELEMRRGWKDGWMLSGNVAGQRTFYVDGVEGRQVPNSPMFIASARGVAPIIRESLNLGSRLTFESGRYDRNEAEGDSPQLLSPPSVVWDITLSGQVFESDLKYLFGVYNVADSQVGVPVSAEFTQVTIPQTGRTVRATITGRLD